MQWTVVKCARFECSKYMITRYGTKRKKCPYCGRSFKTSDNYIQSTRTQEQARKLVQQYNKNMLEK